MSETGTEGKSENNIDTQEKVSFVVHVFNLKPIYHSIFVSFMNLMLKKIVPRVLYTLNYLSHITLLLLKYTTFVTYHSKATHVRSICSPFYLNINKNIIIYK